MQRALMVQNSKPIASISGASGLVGRFLCLKLIAEGYKVKALSRRRSFFNGEVELFAGDIRNVDGLVEFVKGADVVFHCAAELHNESQMWDVNVKGTSAMLAVARKAGIRHFCHLSSAGVTGECQEEWIGEATQCSPRNTYEKSKYAAEQLVREGIPGCSVIILRPTSIIGDEKPGPLEMVLRDSFLNRLKVTIKGAECAHIVHASDVADAAIFLSRQHYRNPELFFVSCDEDPLSRFAYLWSLARAELSGDCSGVVRPVFHLPLTVSHLFRRMLRVRSNRSRFCSAKLCSAGFVFPLGVRGAVKRTIAHRRTSIEQAYG